MQINKILGYILLALGLVLIGWTLWQSYNIFTGKISAPLVFKTPALQEKSGSSAQTLQDQIQNQIDQTVQKQISQILPADTITKILNLAVWSMLAGILIFGGSVISGIGVKLIKI